MSAFLRLVRVELSRLLHRRAILLILAAAVVVPLVIATAVSLETRPASDAEIADAEAQVQRELDNGSYQESIDACIETPDDWGIDTSLGADEIEKQCRETNEPQLEWYLYSPELSLSEQRDDGSGLAVALILGIAMMLLGTTFTGHDWSSGSVSNQLLFEPRRIRVWLAKALVVTGSAFLVAAAVNSAYWLGLNAVASARDLPSGGGLLLDCLQMGWRAALVASLAALAGFALTMLFRSTVATLGILFGVALAGGVLLGILGFEGRWNPALNVAAVITDGTTYWAEGPCPPGESEGGSICAVEKEISLAQGAGFLGTTIVVTSVVSLLWFRRRDVP